MPATSPSTSILIPRRSRVGFSRSLIAAEDRRRGASIWARPAMATCWKSMGWAPVANTEPYRVAFSPPRRLAAPEQTGFMATGGLRGPPAPSAAAAPAREALAAAGGAGDGMDRIGAEPGRLVAGQGLKLVAHLEGVALDEGDRVLDRDLDLAPLLAAARGSADHLHRAGTGRHVDPGAGGQEQGQRNDQQHAHRKHPLGCRWNAMPAIEIGRATGREREYV